MRCVSGYLHDFHLGQALTWGLTVTKSRKQSKVEKKQNRHPLNGKGDPKRDYDHGQNARCKGQASHIDQKGKNTPRKGYGSTPPEADGIQLLPSRQQTAHRSGQGKSDHAARSVDDQVVHIKQTVATLIDKVQTAELGQLKKQRQ